VAAFGQAIHTAAGAANTVYPGQLSELANVVVNNSTAIHRSCGTVTATLATFNATAVTSWNNSGPFVTFMIPTGKGVVTPIGIIQDSMVRSPNSASVGTLAMKIDSVSTSDATNLDQIVDGGDGANAGTVQWVNGAVSGTVDISYFIPVASKC